MNWNYSFFDDRRPKTPYDLAWERAYGKKYIYDRPFDNTTQKEEQLSAEKSVQDADNNKMSKESMAMLIASQPSITSGARSPSLTASATEGLKSGVVTGLATGNPMLGLAVGGLTAFGTYKQASAEAERARREKAAEIALQAGQQQAAYAANMGRLFDEYSRKMGGAVQYL